MTKWRGEGHARSRPSVGGHQSGSRKQDEERGMVCAQDKAR